MGDFLGSDLFPAHFWCHLFLIPDIKFSPVSDLVACSFLDKSSAILPLDVCFTSLVWCSFPFVSEFSPGHILLLTSVILLVHRALSSNSSMALTVHAAHLLHWLVFILFLLLLINMPSSRIRLKARWTWWPCLLHTWISHSP